MLTPRFTYYVVILFLATRRSASCGGIIVVAAAAAAAPEMEQHNNLPQLPTATATAENTHEESSSIRSSGGGKIAMDERPFLDAIQTPSATTTATTTTATAGKNNLRHTSSTITVELSIEDFSFHKVIMIQKEEQQQQQEEDRTLQGLQSATVTLVNNCGYNAHLAVFYESNNFLNGRGFYYVNSNGDNDGSFTIVDPVTSSTLHIYGMKATSMQNTNGDIVWNAPSSEYCFARGDCFSQIDVGSLNSGSVSYNICGDDDNEEEDTTLPPPIAATSSPPPPPAEQSSISARSTGFLNEHNKRRKQWYTQNGISDSPMKWSDNVAASAKNYADKLLAASPTSCRLQHAYMGDQYGGENLSINGKAARSPENIVSAWYDDEINLSDIMKKLHATQIVFRSSRYLGCGEAEKTLSGGGKCYIIVCRYIGAGNCFPSGIDNWVDATLSDTASAKCGGPQCPTEGCF